MRRRNRFSSNGFSVIEALIAAAILLLIAVGVLPLFVRSMTNNVSGSESTRVSNYSKSQVEELFQLPFDGAALTVTAGTESVLPAQYWEDPDPTIDGDERWVTTTTAGRLVTWERVGTVRQYAVSAFDDGVLQAQRGDALRHRDGVRPSQRDRGRRRPQACARRSPTASAHDRAPSQVAVARR